MNVRDLRAGDLVWVARYGTDPICRGMYAVVEPSEIDGIFAEMITVPKVTEHAYYMQVGCVLSLDGDDDLILANDDPKALAALARYRLKGG